MGEIRCASDALREFLWRDGLIIMIFTKGVREFGSVVSHGT